MESNWQDPFYWRNKTMVKKLRENFKGNELVRMRCLCDTLAEITEEIKEKTMEFGKEISIDFLDKKIPTYSGLSEDWILKGFKKLTKLGIIDWEEK